MMNTAQIKALTADHLRRARTARARLGELLAERGQSWERTPVGAYDLPTARAHTEYKTQREILIVLVAILTGGRRRQTSTDPRESARATVDALIGGSVELEDLLTGKGRHQR